MKQHANGFLDLVKDVMPAIREVSADDVNHLLEKQEPMLLIDVREDHEVAKGMIKGATHLGRGIIERDIEKTASDRGTNIILYCGGGYRSALAADSLQKMGYTNVSSMAGGWSGWCEKGYPKSDAKILRMTPIND